MAVRIDEIRMVVSRAWYPIATSANRPNFER